MFVFYTDHKEGSKLLLEGDEARHCIKTLRHKAGDQIQVFDTFGHLFKAEITEIKRNEVECKIRSIEEPKEPKHHITLAIAPTKSADRLEWAISKGVEIGVQRIIIMTTEHTERSRYKLERLSRIMVSAAKQSLNLKLPEILEYSFEETLSTFGPESKKFIAHCNDPEANLWNADISANDQICCMIGPEGDFSTNEIEQAKDHQWIEISLGNSRLRTETAAIVALTLLNAKLST